MDTNVRHRRLTVEGVDIFYRKPGLLTVPSCFSLTAIRAHPRSSATYAFAPARKCYLLPVEPLQRAWRQRGRHWANVYGYRRAQNPGYVTASVPVPIAELMQQIARAMVVQVH